MKLATLKDGTRDGQLIVVSRDLQTAAIADAIAPTLQRVLEDWHFYAPQLRTLYESLNAGRVRRAFKFDAKACMAPLPRTWRCIDATYPVDEKAGGEWFALRRGDVLGGAREDIVVADDARQLTLRTGLAGLLSDVASGAAPMEAVASVRLLTLFAAFRSPAAATVTDAFGAQSVPAAFDATAYDALSFAAVAVTPDVFGDDWHHGVLRRRVDVRRNAQRVSESAGAAGKADAPGSEAVRLRTDIGGFATVTALLAREQAVSAGTIVLGAPGYAFPDAPLLSVGDRIAVDVRDDRGTTYCGPIDISLSPRGEAASS